MIANYVHNLEPIIFSVTDAIKLRWYGLSYLLAFLVGYLLLKRLGDKKLWVLPGNQAGDFISLAAVFGVFLGGRLGNVLIYQRQEFFNDPLVVLRVWEGGMASHGGILGLMIFTLIYAYKKKVSWTGLGDALCVVAPIGIMFGRLANFINGELYGRVARGTEWAMKFPLAINEDLAYKAKEDGIDLSGELFYKLEDTTNLENLHAQGVADACRQSDAVKDTVAQYLEPRYPSQLFQAAGEGLCLFLILYITRIKFPKLPNGILTGMFFIGYAIFRISMENFRQPEIADVSALGITFTMGQFLSLFMILIGAGFIAYGIIRKQPLEQIAQGDSK